MAGRAGRTGGERPAAGSRSPSRRAPHVRAPRGLDLDGAGALQERYMVPGLKRGLEILQLFRRDRPVLRLSDMASDLGLSRSSAFRLAYTLEMLGFLERSEDARSYRLGSRVLGLGFEYLASIDLVEVARPVLERLRDRTGLSAHLAVLEGREILHLVRVPSRGAMTSNVSVGERRPAHATPMGRVLLAEMPDEQLGRLYRGVALTRFTEHTPTSLTALRHLLAGDRGRGHVVSHGTFVPGGSSIAAPVRDRSGAVVAAINVSGPQDAFGAAALASLTAVVLDAAAEVASRLGHQPPAPRGVRGAP